jgi:hypothetical protein
LRALQDASNAVGYLALILLHHMKLRKWVHFGFLSHNAWLTALFYSWTW